MTRKNESPKALKNSERPKTNGVKKKRVQAQKLKRPLQRGSKHEYAVVGRVSSASVQKGSGRGWDEWIQILTKAGAQNWDHKEIVQLLRTKYKLSHWWQQGVAHGFEVAIGKRVDGQNLKGEYSVTATRTFAIDAKALWRLICSPAGVQAWLQPMDEFTLQKSASFEIEGGIYGEVRTIKAGERARLTWRETDWPKATVLNIFIVPRSGPKSILAFHHERLTSARQREELRTHWKTALEKLLMLSEVE